MARGGARPGSGRPRGSRNRKSLAFFELLDGQGLRPEELVRAAFRIVRSQTTTSREKIYAISVVLPFLMPKLAAVDITGELATPTLPMPRSQKEARAALKELLGDLDL